MLRLTLAATATAALMGWLAWTQFNRANAATEALRASQNALRVTAASLVREAEAAREWRDLFEGLEGYDETRSCGASVSRALDLVRQRRANTP